MPWGSFSVLALDDIVWIWWYDRQGAIQTQGINFVQDLPRFLILLFAFQRFKLEDWGFNTTLDPQSEVIHCHRKGTGGSRTVADRCFDFPPPGISLSEPVQIRIDTGNQVHHIYSLTGRGTSVFGGTACPVAPKTTKRSSKPQGSGEELAAVDNIKVSKALDEPREVVVKIYWPGESRLSEAYILDAARTLGKENPDIIDHLPQLVLSHDFPEYSTGCVRERLGLKPSEGRRPARILRLAIFHLLKPITTLVGEEFLRAWFDCVRCECGFMFPRRRILTRRFRPLCPLGARHPTLRPQLVKRDG